MEGTTSLRTSIEVAGGGMGPPVGRYMSGKDPYIGTISEAERGE